MAALWGGVLDVSPGSRPRPSLSAAFRTVQYSAEAVVVSPGSRPRPSLSGCGFTAWPRSPR